MCIEYVTFATGVLSSTHTSVLCVYVCQELNGYTVHSLTSYIHHWIGLFWQSKEGREIWRLTKDADAKAKAKAKADEAAKNGTVATFPFYNRLSTGYGDILRERLRARTPQDHPDVRDLRKVEAQRTLLCAGRYIVGVVVTLFAASGMEVPTNVKMDMERSSSKRPSLDINSVDYVMPFVSLHRRFT